MKRFAAIYITSIHAALTVAVWALGFLVVMNQELAQSLPGGTEPFLYRLGLILSWPLLTIIHSTGLTAGLPTAFLPLLVVVNSFLWAIVVTVLVRRIRHLVHIKIRSISSSVIESEVRS